MQCASARTLRVATIEAVTRLERLGLARTLLVVAVVVVAQLARCAWWLWLSSHMRAQREVQLALRNNDYISATPRKYVFIWLPHWGLIRFFRCRRGQ